MLQNGRSITLLGVLHIFGLVRNMIFFSKMSEAGVHTLFHKDTCKILREVMVLMKGVKIRTMYKLLGIADSTRCNNIVVSKVDSTWVESIPTDFTLLHQVDLTMPWHHRMGHIGEKGLRSMQNKGMV
jgi:hypothetical protein